ncbi:MAG: hypothetical protein RBR74_03615 [Ignavibacteriaceae bacterium]|jgi:hypothetical protein|nr:hypothetical protein [Ignavibacteriaceae bacterium]
MLKKSFGPLLLLILFSCLILQSCYTQVSLPKHNDKKSIVDENRIVSFTYSVVDTFDNDWLPDKGYYYLFRFDLKTLNENNIDRFLNMLYAKGYDISGAWYRPAISDCRKNFYNESSQNILAPQFILLLSDLDDSIIQYNFYAVMNKPYIPCPYDVWEFYESQ